MSRTPRISAAILATTLLTAACSGSGAADTAKDGKPAVIAAFYPLQWLTEQVGGSDVNVSVLTAPGVEPHDLELGAHQVAQLEDAALTVYIKGVQPAVDDAVAQDTSFDAATAVKTLPASEHEEGHDIGYDPHLWLDPSRLATVATKLGERLAATDPAHAQGYRDRAVRTAGALGTLDQEYAKGLTTCATKTLVTSHQAFGYLADRYHLKQIGITLDPEAEPSPARIAEVAKLAKDEKATTIFTESLVSPKVAEVLAKEIGAKTAVLDPLESKPPGDYLSAMRANLKTLQSALGCTA
ncbi:metal ABC transporter substrate-binding protein [Nonomuraea guangzhouensis]|uniref:Metal ABC transporter substrate-binding protein n=1 Tax=Nonomuraea guangzhouensis TaxID=1291555 RepID=A0ABW4G8F7_9ACTN|nr:metal ABC transporter substrate-binding protein [Nonomuraea guangzhouensis]